MMFWQLIISGLCFFLLFPSTSQAQFDEKKLQSLFMTPTEREQVDDIRNGTEKKEITERAVLVEKSEKITVTGFMKRSDGKNVVWLNGKNTMRSNVISDAKVQTRGINSRNEVPVMVDGKRQLLKPGETWLRPTTISESPEAP